MATSPYTPNGATASDADDDVELPDDAEVGIGAINAPFEELADRIAKLGIFGTRVRNFAYVVPEATTGAKMNVASGTSVDWQDITGCMKTVATQPNDRVLVLVQCDTDLGNVGTHSIDLAHAQASAATAEFAGSLRLLDGTDRVGHTLVGMWQATHAEDVTITLRGKAAAGDFSVYGGIVMVVAVIAQTGVWP